MRIGVFDSGIGGKAIASSLEAEFKDAEIVCISDQKHMPYGNRSYDDIIRLTSTAIQPLLSLHCDIIVIACNTATAAAIETLRARYPTQLFIGLEPMLKTAATQTKTNAIAVCATPFTLSSQRYDHAKKLLPNSIKVIEPDCSDWAQLIEANKLNKHHIDLMVDQCRSHNVDVIVLGCTHYHWIKSEIIHACGNEISVLEPSAAIAKRVRELLGA